MTTTIEAVKQAHAVLQSGDLLCEVTAASILREAIATEEAQGVEAVALMDAVNSLLHQIDIGDFVDSHGHNAKMLKPVHDLMYLIARHAPPPTDHTGDTTQLVGKRVTLARRLRGLADAARLRGPGCTPFLTCDDVDVIADMLAADAQEGKKHPFQLWAEYATKIEGLEREAAFYKKLYEKVKAQQAAVPQDSALLDHLQQSGSTVEILPDSNSGASWSFRIGGLHAAVHHDIRTAIDLAMLAAAPQLPQADARAADNIEDVRAMVPMTDQELDDLLPTNDSMSRKDSQRWIARAVERHHGIGVK